MVPVSEPSWRKPVGVFALMAWLTIYAVAVASLADRLNALPVWGMVPAYLVLGLAWVAPLRPLFLWMNTGRWRSRDQ
jgi:hypothetical protein